MKKIFIILLILVTICAFSQEGNNENDNILDNIDLAISQVDRVIEEHQQLLSQNDDLKVVLENVSDMLKDQGNIIRDLQIDKQQLEAIREQQSLVVSKIIFQNKVMKWSIGIGVPIIVVGTALTTYFLVRR
jgi:hypothetical protein